MKKLFLCTIGLSALAFVGCADDYAGEGYYGSSGGVSMGVGPVWYDGFYGPYPTGYWDGDVFLYSDRHGRFLRDEGNHFRHERFEHARRYRSMRHPNTP